MRWRWTLKVLQAAAWVERNRCAERADLKRCIRSSLKPTESAFIEAFNARLRAECLNAHWFLSLAVAAEKLEAWRRDYNDQRQHGAIGNKVLAVLMISAEVLPNFPPVIS